MPTAPKVEPPKIRAVKVTDAELRAMSDICKAVGQCRSKVVVAMDGLNEVTHARVLEWVERRFGNIAAPSTEETEDEDDEGKPV